jgi:hypothetical protein
MERLETAIQSKGFQNDFERIGVMLAYKRSGFGLAPLAETELDSLILILPLPFFDVIFALAIGRLGFGRRKEVILG